MSPKQILQQYWGFEQFRKPQEQIIDDVLTGNDVIAILPTGSGKSIIYQVAGLAQNGITIVISPLIALIEDQVTNLNRRGIKAVALTGQLNFSELERLLNNVQFGRSKFVFLSPERLQNEYAQKRLSQMPINLITVDEAHCISEWGHDFRPAYTKIHELRTLLPDVPILALTATAKPNVVKDIETYLDLEHPKIYRTSVIRPNIAYKVHHSQQKINALISHLKKDESVVVYVKTRKKTYQYANYVAQRGFKTAFFHGGMSFEAKQKALSDWLQHKTYIMFATTAFGMGIDKADVRQVLHLDLPASLENYVQESGRAGRDGQPAEAIIFTDDYDLKYFEESYLQMIPDPDFVYRVYKSLYNHFYIAQYEGEGLEVDLDLINFCNRFKLNVLKTLQAFQILESEAIIQTTQTRTYFASVKILLGPTEIRKYVRNQRFGYQIIDYFIRSYTDIFYLDTKINPKKIADKLELSLAEVKSQLLELQRRQIIDYKPAGAIFAVKFLASYDENLFLFHRKKIEQRLNLKKEKLNQVLAYIIDKKKCRSIFLAEYFGEQNSKACGICDVCLNQKKPESDAEILDRILGLLKDGCLTKHEIQKIFNRDINLHIDKLIENNSVFLSGDFKYCLNRSAS